MILVDTSVWVRHLREGDARLAADLERAEVWMHPWVIGELACRRLADRAVVLGLLRALPMTPIATDHEVLTLIERRSLMGRGIGWVDVQLLASTLLAGTRIWSLDRRLAAVAAELGVAVAYEA
ncbi:MAG: type II toxin-antitoxin system VapC family toxin [Chloroflexi bacterium]|nr:type II toxin-antitoxin system VapC family toxin [Trueperaceae bacterium]MBA4169205.1 type II toxin-antitoxin system VapC family toxin [Chloroflexota bacterium]